MSQYANDLLADGGWRRAYNFYQSKWDLMPMWVPSEWEIIGLEEGAGGSLSCQMNRDFWVYRLTLNAAVLMGSEHASDMLVFPPLYFEYRVSINGQPIGGWVDAYLREGGHDKIGLGAGFRVPQAKSITVDVRRMVALTAGDTGFEQYKLQLVAEGSELFPKGSKYYADGKRNQIMEDWAMEAELRPMWYGDSDELDTNIAGTRVTLQQETDAEPFLLNQITFYQYPTGPLTEYTPNFYVIPFDAEIYVDNQALFSHVSAVACTAWGGYPLVSSFEMRIPFLIKPRSRLIARPGGWPWTKDETVKVGVLFSGNKIIAR